MSMNLQIRVALILGLSLPRFGGSCRSQLHSRDPRGRFRNQKGVAGGTLFTSPDGWPEDNDMSYRSPITRTSGSQLQNGMTPP